MNVHTYTHTRTYIHTYPKLRFHEQPKRPKKILERTSFSGTEQSRGVSYWSLVSSLKSSLRFCSSWYHSVTRRLFPSFLADAISFFSPSASICSTLLGGGRPTLRLMRTRWTYTVWSVLLGVDPSTIEGGVVMKWNISIINDQCQSTIRYYYYTSSTVP